MNHPRPFAVSWDGHFVRFTTQANAELFAGALRQQGYHNVLIAYVPEGQEDEAYGVTEVPL